MLGNNSPKYRRTMRTDLKFIVNSKDHHQTLGNEKISVAATNGPVKI